MNVININSNILFIIYLNFWNLPKLKIDSKTYCADKHLLAWKVESVIRVQILT